MIIYSLFECKNMTILYLKKKIDELLQIFCLIYWINNMVF